MRTTILACVLSLAGCAAPEAFPDDPKARPGEEFTLPAGGSASIDDRYLVTFEKVIEDSRCPMNARCVWEGNARVLITVMELRRGKVDEYQSWPLELNTSERFATRQTASDLTLQMRLLDPTPMAGQPVEKYSVTLVAELRH